MDEQIKKISHTYTHRHTLSVPPSRQWNVIHPLEGMKLGLWGGSRYVVVWMTPYGLGYLNAWLMMLMGRFRWHSLAGGTMSLGMSTEIKSLVPLPVCSLRFRLGDVLTRLPAPAAQHHHASPSWWTLTPLGRWTKANPSFRLQESCHGVLSAQQKSNWHRL